MKSFMGLALVGFLFQGLVALGASPLLDELDALHDGEQHQAIIGRIDARLAENPPRDEQIELLARRSRANLGLGDQMEANGATQAQLLAQFETGEADADRLIALAPDSALGYYWKASNIGRWGQTRGVLSSLFKAGDMRDLLFRALSFDPDHSDSYYVLGMLYAAVPGGISFGNTDNAVGLARRAVALMESSLAQGELSRSIESYYVKLASHLYSRNWNAQRRQREQSGRSNRFQRASTPQDRAFHYESQVEIPSVSDREEARQLLQGAIGRLEPRASQFPGDARTLAEARELLASF